jgi:hypothetical protein
MANLDEGKREALKQGKVKQVFADSYVKLIVKGLVRDSGRDADEVQRAIVRAVEVSGLSRNRLNRFYG